MIKALFGDHRQPYRPAYYSGKKLFPCVYENGVGIKVPEDIAEELIKTERIIDFLPIERAREANQ